MGHVCKYCGGRFDHSQEEFCSDACARRYASSTLKEGTPVLVSPGKVGATQERVRRHTGRTGVVETLLQGTRMVKLHARNQSPEETIRFSRFDLTLITEEYRRTHGKTNQEPDQAEGVDRAKQEDK